MSPHGGSLADLRQRNSLLLKRALFFERMSRAQLARQLGLTRAAVSDHVDEMLAAGLVREVGTEGGRRGRTAALLDIAPAYGCFGGLYLNREGAWVGAVDMKGRQLFCEALQAAEPDALVELAAQRLLAGLKMRGIPRKRLLGVGASSPGPLDEAAGIVLTPPNFEPWQNYPLAPQLAGQVGVPVQLENNATAYAHAELLFGHGRHLRDFVFLIVDSGISGGVVMDGQLLHTKSSSAELGHTSIEMEGRPCACGNRGCLERYAAIPELLHDHFDPKDSMESWAQVVDGAEAGEACCMKALEAEARYLAVTLTSCVNIFEPEALVLSGDVSYKPEMLLKALKTKIGAQAIMRRHHQVTVLVSGIGPGGWVPAAASAALGAFYQV